VPERAGATLDHQPVAPRWQGRRHQLWIGAGGLDRAGLLVEPGVERAFGQGRGWWLWFRRSGFRRNEGQRQTTQSS
jgi:hypothetical protein